MLNVLLLGAALMMFQPWVYSTIMYIKKLNLTAMKDWNKTKFIKNIWVPKNMYL